jgi:tetratricopeptide (TPR) repeat protein
LLIEQGKEDQAIALLKETLRLKPDYVEAYNAFGQALSNVDKKQEAEIAFTQALELRPNCPEVLLSLGKSASDQGEFERAQELFERALKIDPKMPEALAGLAYTQKMTTDDASWLQRAQELAAQPLTRRHIVMLYFAMGKFCDDTEEYDKAFSFYRQANEERKKYIGKYDRVKEEELVNSLINSYSATFLGVRQPGADDSQRPVFVVGMPRSGTSLIEQIIASHPEAYGAGELSFWHQRANELGNRFQKASFQKKEISETATGALQNLIAYDAHASRIVDKMPDNFKLLGFIHTVFPQARILHVRRNPVDTCLSIYFQNFKSGHTYSNDIEDLSHYYQQYHRLMGHWRSVLQDDIFLEVPYESLIEEQESWIQHIINFIGLSWDEQCLSFYKTKRRVGTSSNWQTRQPIYKSSKERWRNYEKYVEPLLPLLDLYKIK